MVNPNGILPNDLNEHLRIQSPVNASVPENVSIPIKESDDNDWYSLANRAIEALNNFSLAFGLSRANTDTTPKTTNEIDSGNFAGITILESGKEDHAMATTKQTIDVEDLLDKGIVLLEQNREKTIEEVLEYIKANKDLIIFLIEREIKQ